MYPKRLPWTILFALTNVGLLLYTLIRGLEPGSHSLSTPILMILAVNVGIFLSYYMIRKLLEICKSDEGEGTRTRKIMRFFSFIFFIFALFLGGCAMVFYIRKHQSRNKTPPESRDMNELCSFMDFFDNHDFWHFVSATALFLAFVFLLTIDDDILLQERNSILVF